MNPFNAVWSNEYFRFFGVFIITFVIAEVFLIIIRRYIAKRNKKYGENIDHELLSLICKPSYYIILIIGFYLAFQFLAVPVVWTKWTDRIVFILVIILSAHILSRILIKLTNHWLTVEKRHEKTPRLVGKIISVLLYLIGFVMVLNFFDINITPIIATLGIGGLAAGLALQSTLGNFFAGLHIISDRAFNVGDLIQVNQLNVEGYIEDIGWRTTRIKTLQNIIAIVPNAKIAESVILNTELPTRNITISLVVGVSYQSDLQQVEDISLDVARQVQQDVPGVDENFKAIVRFTEFGESNILFKIILNVTSQEDKAIVLHELIKRLKIRYKSEGIEISFPSRNIYYPS